MDVKGGADMWGQILNWYLKRYMNNAPSWMNEIDTGQWMQYVMPMIGNSGLNQSGRRAVGRAPNRGHDKGSDSHYGKGKHRHAGGHGLPGMPNHMPWGGLSPNRLPQELPPWIQNMISPPYGGSNHPRQSSVTRQNNFSALPFGMLFGDMMNQWPFNQANIPQIGRQGKGNSVR